MQVLLVWRHVSWRCPPACQLLLDDVSGALTAAEVQGVLGPSGAGKSSLLDCLACAAAPQGARHVRLHKSHLTGSVALGPQPGAAGSVHVVHQQQHDALLPHLTASEALTFALLMAESQRRGARSTPLPLLHHDELVERVLAALWLTHCRHTRIGGRLASGHVSPGLSGGERRRLALGLEMIRHGRALFGCRPHEGDQEGALAVLLDEPTSGDEAAGSRSRHG